MRGGRPALEYQFLPPGSGTDLPGGGVGFARDQGGFFESKCQFPRGGEDIRKESPNPTTGKTFICLKGGDVLIRCASRGIGGNEIVNTISLSVKELT